MSHVSHQHRRVDDPEYGSPPAGLTYEQLEFFTEQTHRAVRIALLRYSKRAAMGFVLLFAAFIGNLLYSNHLSAQAREAVVRSGDLIAVDGCNRDFQDRQAVRGVLIASKDFTEQAVKRGNIPEAEGQVRLEFYNDRLRELPLPDCRLADDVLTDDPNAPVVVPQPLHPTDATERVVPPSNPRPEEKDKANP